MQGPGGEAGPFEVLNALDATAMASVVARYHIDTIFNLVALLSAVGERNPQMAWHVNMGAFNNSLEVARQHHCALFTPSSIGAGPSSPKVKTPQDTIMQPTTIYGICKVTGEMLGNYYHHKYGVDTRSVRFPGIISNVTLPGGGTTDYAVEIYYEAIKSGKFTCPVPPDVYMDMIYMPDVLRACVELMEADPAKLVHRNSFNIMTQSNVRAAFERHFNTHGTLYASAGRINLIGEHTDYNGGFVFPGAVDCGITAMIRPNGTDRVRAYAVDLDSYAEFGLREEDKPSESWARYIFGVCREIQKRGGRIGGFDTAFSGDVPLGAGMSSSAALSRPSPLRSTTSMRWGSTSSNWHASVSRPSTTTAA